MHAETQDGLARYTVESQTNFLTFVLQGALAGAAAMVFLGFRNKYGLATLVVCATLAALMRPAKRESVMAVKGVGLQINHYGHLRVIGDSCLFIPYHDILDILINEVFIGLQILPVIQIVRKDCQDLVLAFESLTPPLADLETVWRGLREALIEGPEDVL